MLLPAFAWAPTLLPVAPPVHFPPRPQRLCLLDRSLPPPPNDWAAGVVLIQFFVTWTDFPGSFLGFLFFKGHKQLSPFPHSIFLPVSLTPFFPVRERKRIFIFFRFPQTPFLGLSTYCQRSPPNSFYLFSLPPWSLRLPIQETGFCVTFSLSEFTRLCKLFPHSTAVGSLNTFFIDRRNLYK